MIHFNPRSGQLFREDELLSNESILGCAHEAFCLQEGQEDYFSLLSIKRMLNHYPDLIKITDWAKSFMEYAQHIPERIGILRSMNKEYDEHEIQYLTLQRTHFANYTELTGRVDLDSPGLQMKWEDKEYLDINEGSQLSGLSKAGDQSLSYTRLHQIYYMPIKLLQDKHVMTWTYAQENRKALDYSTHVRFEYMSKSTVSLNAAVLAIMMDINLDEEEVFQDQMEMFHGRLEGAVDHFTTPIGNNVIQMRKPSDNNS